MTAVVEALRFYPGLHQPADARHFDRAFMSINRLRGRRKPVACTDVVVDSAAFTELEKHGRYRHDVSAYAGELRRLHAAGVVTITAAVAQDYMCEPFMLARTGLTVAEHQRLTIERFDALVAFDLPFPIMPVLQGFAPADYVAHLAAYGGRLTPGMWVGVGSVCKRNGQPERVVEVLHAIKSVRPDLRLHGFGVKKTSLLHPGVRELLYSADSMAWSFSARKQGRDANDWREARSFTEAVLAAAGAAFRPWQMPLLRSIARFISSFPVGSPSGACGGEGAGRSGQGAWPRSPAGRHAPSLFRRFGRRREAPLPALTSAAGDCDDGHDQDGRRCAGPREAGRYDGRQRGQRDRCRGDRGGSAVEGRIARQRAAGERAGAGFRRDGGPSPHALTLSRRFGCASEALPRAFPPEPRQEVVPGFLAFSGAC